MEVIRSIFCERDATWKKVVFLSLFTGVLTGIVLIIPSLKDTSFQDIGINLECWIVFALYIILNQNHVKEAVIKCFVFFLISQPLIYLLQVPFSDLGWGIFAYYRRWFLFTLLTIPGAAIAYQVKRRDFISVLVLCVPEIYFGLAGISYLASAAGEFPNHLLSGLCCIAFGILFPVIFLDEKIARGIVIAVLTIAVGASLIQAYDLRHEKISLEKGTWDYVLSEDEVVEVEIEEDAALLHTIRDGYTRLSLEEEDGSHRFFDVTVSGGGIFVTEDNDDSDCSN